MLTDYFGAIKSGKLLRMRFVGLWVLLIFIFIGFAIAIGVGLGVSEHLIGGDLAAAQNALRGAFAIPAMIIIGVLVLAFIFANLNIVAKRARDVGLPGWITSIIIALLSGGGSQVSGGGGGGIGGLLLLILVFLPSGLIKPKS